MMCSADSDAVVMSNNKAAVDIMAKYKVSVMRLECAE
jgi:hypothetical protein